MVESGQMVQEGEPSTITNGSVVKKKQYEFENLNLGISKEDLEENSKKPFKKYVPWIIVGLVLAVLVVLIFVFDII